MARGARAHAPSESCSINLGGVAYEIVNSFRTLRTVVGALAARRTSRAGSWRRRRQRARSRSSRRRRAANRQAADRPVCSRSRARSRTRNSHDLPAARALDGRAPRARLGRRRLRQERAHVPRVLERDRVARLRRHRRRPADRATGRRSRCGRRRTSARRRRRRSAGGPLHHGERHGARGSHGLARGGEQEPQQPLLRKSERRAHRGDGHVVRRVDVVRSVKRSARGDGGDLEQRPVRGRAQRGRSTPASMAP